MIRRRSRLWGGELRSVALQLVRDLLRQEAPGHLLRQGVVEPGGRRPRGRRVDGRHPPMGPPPVEFVGTGCHARRGQEVPEALRQSSGGVREPTGSLKLRPLLRRHLPIRECMLPGLHDLQARRRVSV